MVERLRQIADDVDPARSAYANIARAEVMVDSGPPADTRGRFLFAYELAEQLLFGGQFTQAIDRILRMQEELANHDLQVSHTATIPDDFTLQVQHLLAASYLRLAGRENCLTEDGTVACLFPIRDNGVHRFEDGARAASRIYQEILRRQPDDLSARWLLNLAYMMIGEHPDLMPSQWLIPQEAFESEYDIRRFPDVAPGLGVDVAGRLGGVIMDDFDGDGYLDIMTSAWGLRDQLRYFRNDADGSFTERTLEAGLDGLVGGINLIQADYDNDGCLDVLVLRGAWSRDGHPNSLLRNSCDGGFEDVSEEAGIIGEHATLSAAWGDYDNDGWVDLFVANESRLSSGTRSQLFRNNGDGTFTDVARETGAAVGGFNKGVVWGDFDNDGRLDLYVSRLGRPNILLRNEGPNASGVWRFTDVAAQAGVTEPVESFPTWFWDYDNDGWLDIFVSGYRTEVGDIAAEYLKRPHQAELPRLYRNNGDGTFSDVTATARLDRIMFTMGANFGDLDNDGWLDLYVGTGDAFPQALIPNRMFRNAGGEFFQDVTSSGGFGHILKGHGVAFGDWDSDGDQDVYVTMGGAYEGDLARNVLFANPGHGNKWVTLKLEGDRSNRAAIGARIHVTVETAAGLRDIYRTVSSGGSFGANSLQLEIGLAEATAIHEVAITWPATGETDVYDDIDMNRTYRIREGDPRPTLLALGPLEASP